MTALPPGSWTPPRGPGAAPQAPRWGAGRIVALVVGLVLLLPGLALVTGGGVLMWADLGNRTDDGYLRSADDTFTTSGYAIVSDRLELSTGADWLPIAAAVGDARIEVTPTDPGTEIFVGIARVGDSSPYFDGVERTVVHDLGSGGNDEELIAGHEPNAAPTSEDFWAAQVSGTGPQQLTWTPADGDWTFVVMNADGSAGVSVEASIGATVPALRGLAWGVLITGVFLTVIGLLVVALAVRRRPVPPSYGYPGQVPPGPATGGTPPPGPASTGTLPPWVPPVPTDRTTAADARPGSESSTPRDPRSG